MPREKDSAPWSAGPARVRRVSGRERDGLFYWRAVVVEDGKERLVWAGWGRRLDPAITLEIVTAGTAALAPTVEPPATVRALLGSWRADQERRGEDGEIKLRTLSGYRNSARHLSRALGDVLLDRLDVAQLAEYARGRRAAGIAGQTVRHELSHLATAWKWGRRRGLAPERDLELPQVKAPPVRDRHTPTAGDVAAVLRHLDGWARRLVVLLYATGARVGEVAALTWDRVHLEAEVVELDGKTGPRQVPLVGEALRELGRTPEAERVGRVVAGVTEQTALSVVYRELRRACAAAGVPRILPHGLRRHAVDALYEAGADVGIVASLIGHSPEVALRHYRQARPESKRRALIDAGLGTLPEGAVLDLDAERRRR